MENHDEYGKSCATTGPFSISVLDIVRLLIFC